MSEQGKCLRRACVVIPSLDLDFVNDCKHVLDSIYLHVMLQLHIFVVARSDACQQRLSISLFLEINCDVLLNSLTLDLQMIHNIEVLSLDSLLCPIF